MGNTLLNYKDKYFLYDGDLKIEERGLTIGGYESAWLADLCVSYLLEVADEETRDEAIVSQIRPRFDHTEYFGVYRDDGIAIFKDIKSPQEILLWLNNLQTKINEIAGNNFSQVYSGDLGTR